MHKAMAVLVALAAIGSGVAAAQANLAKTATVDVAGIETLAIDVQVADVRLTSRAAAVVRADVVLDSRDAARLSQCARSELRTERNGGTLRLTLSQSGRERCHERWSIELPPGVAVKVTVAVGSIDARLSGGYGSLDLHAAVGRAHLDVDGRRVRTSRRQGPSESIQLEGPGPELSLRSSVGNVTAVVTTRG
jgi:hypothetical protein